LREKAGFFHGDACLKVGGLALVEIVDQALDKINMLLFFDRKLLESADRRGMVEALSIYFKKTLAFIFSL
jgi:hypothetical protein